MLLVYPTLLNFTHNTTKPVSLFCALYLFPGYQISLRCVYDAVDVYVRDILFNKKSAAGISEVFYVQSAVCIHFLFPRSSSLRKYSGLDAAFAGGILRIGRVGNRRVVLQKIQQEFPVLCLKTVW